MACNSCPSVMSTASLSPSVVVQPTACTGSGAATKAEVKSSPSLTSLPGARRPSAGSSGRVPPPPPVRHPSTTITSTSGTSGRRSSHSAVGSGSGSSSSGGGRAWANAYELSQDMRDRQMEALARRLIFYLCLFCVEYTCTGRLR